MRSKFLASTVAIVLCLVIPVVSSIVFPDVLFVAGVPSVIVSLWKVPDESTSFLMTEFYKNWKQRNLTKAQALRQAMLTTRAKYPRPIDWAAFTLIGEAE
jgi:CHAT domain-containing protein